MRKFRLSDFDYFLPSGLIAQYPLERGKEKLLVFHKKSGKIEHRVFENIVDYFQPGDMLLLNNTKVIKARVFTRRKSGGKVEVFFLNKIDDFSFKGLLRPYSRVKVGEVFEFDKCKLKVEDKEMGYAIFKLEGLDVKSFFEIYGKMPLPPYIKREAKKEDENYYQTIFASEEGSVAAPTAGLHFTKKILEKIKEKKVKVRYITLHVGIGTFKPVKVEDISKHKMDAEYYKIPKEIAEEIKETKLKKLGRIFVCGTTVMRAVETWALTDKTEGWTELFIYPPFKFNIADCFLTNFHLPKSTPLILTSAFVGSPNILLKVYEVAIKEKYRFLSYGDVMLIIS